MDQDPCTYLAGVGAAVAARHGAPSWTSLSLLSSEWTGPDGRNDDDEDQYGAVLWISNRKAEVKEPEQRERKTRSTRCAHAVPRVRPRDEEPLQQCTETDQSTL